MKARTVSARGVRFVVAGVTGGAGTTTVAALLSVALDGRFGMPPSITDHTGGFLATRVNTTNPDTTRWVDDMGAHAEELDWQPGIYPVIVTSVDQEAGDNALFILQSLAISPSAASNEADGPAGARGVIIVNSTSPRRLPDPEVSRLAKTAPGATIIGLPWDAALSTPMAINRNKTAPVTMNAIAQVLGAFSL